MGKFQQPPKGPELGPVKEFKDLPPEKREQLGNMADIISKPAPIDPRVLAAEQAPQEPVEASDPEAETQRTNVDVASEIEALRAVLDRSEPEDDPEEALMAEAAQPNEEDKRQFMRCLFGDTPYRKEYKLFGGMLVVEMTDVTPLIEDRIFMQLSLDQKTNKIETQDDWDIALDRYRMVVNIHKVIWSGNEILGPVTGTNLGDAVTERITKGLKNSVVYRALLRTMRVFRRHLDVMLERSMTSDFWQVDGPSSQPEAT
jgi:hypothetical protein